MGALRVSISWLSRRVLGAGGEGRLGPALLKKGRVAGPPDGEAWVYTLPRCVFGARAPSDGQPSPPHSWEGVLAWASGTPVCGSSQPPASCVTLAWALVLKAAVSSPASWGPQCPTPGAMALSATWVFGQPGQILAPSCIPSCLSFSICKVGGMRRFLLGATVQQRSL